MPSLRAPQSNPKKKFSSSINQAFKILFLELLSTDCSDFHQISGCYLHWILQYCTISFNSAGRVMRDGPAEI